MEYEKGRSRPFILYPRRNITDIRSCVLENFGRIKYELPFLNALCVQIPEEKVQNIKTNRRVAMMAEDAAVSKLPVESPFPGGVFPLRRKSGLHGDGVSIAIIDTGVAPHYDLTRPFNRIVCFRDFINGRVLPYDDDGHGTHVAGIALGNGYSSGKYAGAAPKASLVSLKALDREGSGNISDILAAMQWVWDNHHLYNIRVVNLSLGISPSPQSQIDPLVLGANALVCQGICVVAAAGNGGPGKGTITSPGTSPLVLTVGSCDDHYRMADFSSRGPTPTGFPKPEVLAPGIDVVSLSAENLKGYLAQTGTSMSAPYVAGLAAGYFARHPQAHPLEVRSVLLTSSASAVSPATAYSAAVSSEVASPFP